MEVRWSSLGKFSFRWSIFEVPETVRRSEPVIGSEIVISNYIKSFWVQRKEKGQKRLIWVRWWERLKLLMSDSWVLSSQTQIGYMQMEWRVHRFRFSSFKMSESCFGSGSVISAENTENGPPGEDPMIFFFKKRRTWKGKKRCREFLVEMGVLWSLRGKAEAPGDIGRGPMWWRR